MDTEFITLISYAVIIVGFIFWAIFKGWKKGRALFTVKKLINGFSFIFNWILAVYVIIIGTSLFPAIFEWSLAQSIKWADNDIVVLIFRSVPLAFALFLIYIIIKMIFKQWIPYNEKEKTWLKEEQTKAKDGKLNRFLMSIPIFRLIAGRKNEDEIKPDDEKLH